MFFFNRLSEISLRNFDKKGMSSLVLLIIFTDAKKRKNAGSKKLQSEEEYF